MLRIQALAAMLVLGSANSLALAQPTASPTPAATAPAVAAPAAPNVPGVLPAAAASPEASAEPGTTGSSAAPGTTEASAAPVAIGAVPTEAPDPYLWLEAPTSPRAMAWVKNENAKSLGVLEADPRFNGLYADALKIAQAKDRIASPAFIQGKIFNFWQDAVHVRGIWRSTTRASYATAHPVWTTVLDLDALAKKERANWVWEGANCVWPSERRCLISLSDGGEDAVTIREFDLGSKTFVKNGFSLPRGKQSADWEDENDLLVSREWVPGELTASGYPYVVKRLHRGRPLADAFELFRGQKSDISVGAFAYVDSGHHEVTIVTRGVTFFTSEHYVLTPKGIRQMNVPAKFQVRDLVLGQLICVLDEDWTAAGKTFLSGSVVSIPAAGIEDDPGNLHPTLVYAPGPRDSVGDIGATSSHLLIASYHNVRGLAAIYSLQPDGTWLGRNLDLPDDASIGLAAEDKRSEDAFLSVTGYLTPTTLWSANAASGKIAIAKSLPPKFDASNDVVEQRESTSKDGTKIPYFIVHPKNMKLDGTNPTILYGYGGFDVSLTPAYSGLTGKLWLERGGVYVVANIRGGGEFGPAWHDAGLKTKRQVIYDDFTSVANDLIARNVTSPQHLGIQGGSNGGLLMGVEFTQHPELFNAVDIQVPLLDMLRFEQIAAGASWVGEYGSVSVPAERAFLASISPYNNLKAGVKYPEPFVWSTTKDDRVGPQHARKFAARLSEMGIPYLFYEVTEGGHGSGANLRERSKTTALEMVYFIRKLIGPASS